VNQSEIHNRLSKLFPSAGLVLEEIQPEPVCRIPREQLVEVSALLRDDPSLHFDCLMCLSAVEKGPELHTVYHLYSIRHHHRFTLRCIVAKEDAVMPSVSTIWPTAEWHEREAYDMMGIQFSGHPDHRRILCADDWEGHPLRKDYKSPESFHDIPLTNIFPPDLPL
jgi:NADH-quinone oxidoreductase subunit C